METLWQHVREEVGAATVSFADIAAFIRKCAVHFKRSVTRVVKNGKVVHPDRASECRDAIHRLMDDGISFSEFERMIKKLIKDFPNLKKRRFLEQERRQTDRFGIRLKRRPIGFRLKRKTQTWVQLPATTLPFPPSRRPNQQPLAKPQMMLWRFHPMAPLWVTRCHHHLHPSPHAHRRISSCTALSGRSQEHGPIWCQTHAALTLSSRCCSVATLVASTRRHFLSWRAQAASCLARSTSCLATCMTAQGCFGCERFGAMMFRLKGQSAFGAPLE